MLDNIPVNNKFKDIFDAERAITNKHKDLIGLAFSGGGIRSATTNLGVLQALSCKNLLSKFDYLSTVSGGGYIGGFLSAMIWHAKGNVTAVEQKLCAKQECQEVNFLRKYSNYLTPKIGFSTDTMAAFSVWLTNTLLNQLVLISTIATLCALGFGLNYALAEIKNSMYFTQSSMALFGLILAILAGILALKESLSSGENQNEGNLTHTNSAPLSTRWRLILSIGLTGIVLIALWLTTKASLNWMALQPHPNVFLSPFWLINPAFIVIICIGIILGIGLLGRRVGTQAHSVPISSFVREWWARLGGVTLYLCGGWLASYFLVLYLPLKLDHFLSNYTLPSVGIWGTLASLSAFLGKSSATSGLETQKIKEKITILLPWLVIAGLVVLVSLGVFKLGNAHFLSKWPASLVYFGIAAIFSAIAALFAWRVDINVFSLHYFYRNRLTRAYLGATNTKRNPSLFTGFDPDDDVKLDDCNHRPLHIVNTALNLTNAKDLAWQQRMAASFSFTPLQSGFQLPNGQGAYQPSNAYTGAEGIKLGSVMAVSGAAASPNGGYHTAPATAFLMTMFNARLGRWYGNPLKNRWRNSSPAFGFSYLVKELFAKADVDSNYVYLSDGGHFENLGIYELVRRQCKLIIAVDAGQDGNYQFEDLGNAIRKCQVDFGYEINIDVKDLHPILQSKYGDFKHAKQHFALGEIIYDTDKPENNGILLYIKNSLTGAEPTDLINFKLQEPTFPHHSTIDQFFDESQFESYRCLGEHMANCVLDALSKPKTIDARKAKDLLGI